MTSYFRHKKKFGQNFLKDQQIIERIIRLINPKSGEAFVEIGPGLGALTQKLLPILETLTVIEIDDEAIEALENSCRDLGKLTVIHQDVLTVDFAKVLDPVRIRVVGNLPYNISTPILFHLIKALGRVIDMTVMLQKEVVDRMVAAPGSKVYGRLSVMLQYHCKVEFLLHVPPGAFDPPPKVNSAIVHLVPHKEKPASAQNEALLSRVVQQAFGQRRKTLKNSLKELIKDINHEKITIDLSLRPEQLSVTDFVVLTNDIEKGNYDGR